MLRSKILWRLLAISVVGVLVILQPASLVAGGVPGREFSRCIQSCNDVRGVCGDICDEDCWALYPNDRPARDACKAACKDICAIESGECKIVCQAIKEEPSPEEP